MSTIEDVFLYFALFAFILACLFKILFPFIDRYTEKRTQEKWKQYLHRLSEMGYEIEGSDHYTELTLTTLNPPDLTITAILPVSLKKREMK